MTRLVWFSLLLASVTAFNLSSKYAALEKGLPHNKLENHRNIQRQTFVSISRKSSLSMVSISSPGGGGASVLEKPDVLKAPEKSKQGDIENSKGWEVRIYNDAMNTREHVARVLVEVTGLNEGAAYQVMMQAHKNGVAAVGAYAYEKAETYYEQLKTNGIMSDMVPLDDE
eukprot:CAMPEP_0194272402 /NCGR_PEP_ID=MMETSP0169-20130528/5986_1 /TAXON_ID=218684 /ORGANISM="Corethron pennatum, Strain L29A3" /LENGTH=169 /DNA_ID=CAMNT_0039015059 /DNA_START=324 /DNA_END=833 /DNA_ORIENTATION=+